MIEQAIYGTEGPEGYHFLARSAGFRDSWLGHAQQICVGFGERPAGVACPLSVFALPFDSRHVAVVQVADQGHDFSGRPGALAFRLLLVPRYIYNLLGGDPFRIADHFPPLWQERGDLPVLEWPSPFVPVLPTVAELKQILDVPYSSTLLGGAQALVDGGHLVFERLQPELGLVRNLWALLPLSTRCTRWPSSFAFGNKHRFDVAVVPRASEVEFVDYVVEAAAGDYPEGRYELALQTAVEHDQQDDLTKLFFRRSSGQTLFLACWLVGVFLFAALLSLAVKWSTQVASPPESSATRPLKPELGPADADPPLELVERQRLEEDLKVLCRRYKAQGPSDPSPMQLLLALEALDGNLDLKDSRRDLGKLGRIQQGINAVCGPAAGNPIASSLVLTFGPSGRLRDQGSLQRALRVLLWKQGVRNYNNPRLNTSELIQELEKKLVLGKE